MAMNKKNFLKLPAMDLGQKEAIHLPIVSVRAGGPLKRGQWATMNEDGLAVSSSKKDGAGFVNPFGPENVATGDSFCLCLDADQIENVSHVWDHPKFSFTPPTGPPKRNKWLQGHADSLKVSYETLMEACQKAANDEPLLVYPNALSDEQREELDAMIYDIHWDIFGEWSGESGHEFENEGSACCPEYDYPEELFSFREDA